MAPFPVQIPTRYNIAAILAGARRSASGVPLIYHQMWYASGPEPTPGTYVGPDKYFKSCATFAQYHPEWIHILWTNDTIDWLLEQPQLSYYRKALVDKMHYPIQISDVARLVILYSYGGVYADLDVSTTSNYMPLIEKMRPEQELLLFYENDLTIDQQDNPLIFDCIINNWMIAKPRSRMVGELLSHIETLIPDNPPEYQVLYLTGPRAIHSYIFGHPGNEARHKLPKGSVVAALPFSESRPYYNYPRDDNSGWKGPITWAAIRYWLFYLFLVLILIVILVCIITYIAGPIKFGWPGNPFKKISGCQHHHLKIFDGIN